MKKILMILGGLFLVIIVIGIAAGGGSSDEPTKVGENGTAVNNQEESAAAPSTTDIVYQIGDQVKSGDFVFSVNEVRRDTGSGFIKPDDGNVYLIPNVTIENQSVKEVNISTLLQMYIKDGEGNKYTPTLTQDSTGKVDGELLAGEKVKGDVGFEVPANAKELYFYYEASWLTGKTIKVKLSK